MRGGPGRTRRRWLLSLVLLCAALAGCADRPPTPTPTAPVMAIDPTVVAIAPTPTAPAGVAPIPPNPLIGRGKRVAAAGGVDAPAGVVDGRYCTPPGWHTGSLPSWLAIEVGAGPSRLLLSWNSGYTDNYTGGQAAGVPATYTLETSADSTNGADGTWEAVARVQGNAARTRAHSIPFAGAAWVRMTVAAVGGGGDLAIDEIDIHDTSRGAEDTVFFLGDSITVGAHQRCDRVQPDFAALVHNAHPAYYPAMIDGGVSGVTSAYGAQQIERLLAENPDYRIWAIGYGTNDAFQRVTPEAFARQMQAIIDRARAAGREPVLARIPYSTAGGADPPIRALNAVIDRLTRDNGLRPGPDLYGWFMAHPDELAPDGVHPEDVGAKSISRLWFEALGGRYAAR